MSTNHTRAGLAVAVLTTIALLTQVGSAQRGTWDPDVQPHLGGDPGLNSGEFAPADLGLGDQTPNGLVSHVVTREGQPTTLILVDPIEKKVGVYHVDPASGRLQLKSIRQVTWDMQMVGFNSGLPKPQDVRDALPRR